MYGLRKAESQRREDGRAAAAVQGAAPAAVSRRAALKGLGLAVAGLALGCTPLRIVLRAYPDAFDDNERLLDAVLRAFVQAVIPGAPLDAPDLVRVFADEAYPFAGYRSFFASDLCRRSADRFGEPRFDALGLKQRTEVIQGALAADATTQKLYNGAIFLAQLSFYAGIYDADHGCPLIEFDGRFRGVPLKHQTYPHPARFIPRELTPDGNYA